MSLETLSPLSTVLPPHPALSHWYGPAPSKRRFLRDIFDDTAHEYDHVERLLSLGQGRRYRREALERAGLSVGMKVLDVAAGTGLVAREEVTLVGDPRLVIGLDPSPGMLRQATDALGISAVLGVGEQIPFAADRFDFLSMGFALRHLGDLHRAFAEFFRVLRPGGRLCLLEITAPRGRLMRTLMRGYMRGVIPLLTRLTTVGQSSQRLWQYYWDTIEACVPPEKVMEAIGSAGFSGVSRNDEFGIFSEYTATKLA